MEQRASGSFFLPFAKHSIVTSPLKIHIHDGEERPRRTRRLMKDCHVVGCVFITCGSLSIHDNSSSVNKKRLLFSPEGSPTFAEDPLGSLGSRGSFFPPFGHHLGFPLRHPFFVGSTLPEKKTNKSLSNFASPLFCSTLMAFNDDNNVDEMVAYVNRLYAIITSDKNVYEAASWWNVEVVELLLKLHVTYIQNNSIATVPQNS